MRIPQQNGHAEGSWAGDTKVKFISLFLLLSTTAFADWEPVVVEASAEFTHNLKNERFITQIPKDEKDTLNLDEKLKEFQEKFRSHYDKYLDIKSYVPKQTEPLTRKGTSLTIEGGAFSASVGYTNYENRKSKKKDYYLIELWLCELPDPKSNISADIYSLLISRELPMSHIPLMIQKAHAKDIVTYDYSTRKVIFNLGNERITYLLPPKYYHKFFHVFLSGIIYNSKRDKPSESTQLVSGVHPAPIIFSQKKFKNITSSLNSGTKINDVKAILGEPYYEFGNSALYMKYKLSGNAIGQIHFDERKRTFTKSFVVNESPFFTKSKKWYLKNWPSIESQQKFADLYDGTHIWSNSKGVEIGKITKDDRLILEGINYVNATSNLRHVTIYENYLPQRKIVMFARQAGEWKLFKDLNNSK